MKYCPDDGLFRPKHVGNSVNTSYLINIVHLLVLHNCSLMYKMHRKTHIKNYRYIFPVPEFCDTLATCSHLCGKAAEPPLARVPVTSYSTCSCLSCISVLPSSSRKKENRAVLTSSLRTEIRNGIPRNRKCLCWLCIATFRTCLATPQVKTLCQLILRSLYVVITWDVYWSGNLPCCLINGMICEKVIEHEMCILIFSTSFVWVVSYYRDDSARCTSILM